MFEKKMKPEIEIITEGDELEDFFFALSCCDYNYSATGLDELPVEFSGEQNTAKTTKRNES